MKRCLPVLLLTAIVVFSGCRRPQGATLTDSLPLDANTVLRIYLEPTSESDLARTLSYDIVRNNVSLMSKRHGFGGVPTDAANGLMYEVLKTADGKVIGLTEKHNSNEVRIVYDFVTGFNWPYCHLYGSDYVSDTNNAHLRRNMLEADLKRGPLTVGGQVGQLMGVTR